MKKYFSIELLRFLTSLSVLLYHYRHFFSPYNILSRENYEIFSSNLPFYSIINSFYSHGFYGVHVFYTISGFVFAYVYLSLKRETSIKEFSINRIARLYPLHFLTLIIVAILQLSYLLKFGNFQFDLINDFYHFLLQLFFISSWGFESGNSFNGPIWSVSVEIGIYIIFFFLIKFINKYNIYLLILLSLILIIIDKLNYIDTLFLECARLFFSGVLIYYLYEKFIKNKSIFFLFGLILMILSFIGNFKTFVFCPAILMVFLSLENFIKNENLKSIFNSLGNLTYSLYLLHIPFQLMIIYTTYLLFGDLDIIYNNYFFTIYFVTLFVIAHFTFNLYEKPLNRFIRKKFSPKKT